MLFSNTESALNRCYLSMELVKLTCTENNRTLDASVLKKSDRFLEVVVEGTDTKVTLAKKSPDERVYVGHMAGLEFISTG